MNIYILINTSRSSTVVIVEGDREENKCKTYEIARGVEGYKADVGGTENGFRNVLIGQ